MRLIFHRPLPWPARHPFACLWFLLIAFGVVGRIDFYAATRRAEEAERMATLRRECARGGLVDSNATLTCAAFQRGQPIKRPRN